MAIEQCTQDRNCMMTEDVPYVNAKKHLSRSRLNHTECNSENCIVCPNAKICSVYKKTNALTHCTFIKQTNDVQKLL